MNTVLGKIMDRLTFWNMPSFVKSYELPIEHETFHHRGVEIWRIPGKVDGPTVLFCHGNAGNLRFPVARRDRFLALHEAGANLWAFDYRGYGKSLGSPTEWGVYQDAVSVHDFVRSQHDPGLPFVLYGRSLGGAVATYLATEIQVPDSMILESTFTSVPDVCARWSHPRLAALMSYKFDSLERIRNLDCPLCMIHGTSDVIVGHDFGQQLFEACPKGQQFVSVPGAGHNDLQQAANGLYEETLARWLRLK